jgi:hypothetical protein
MNKVIEISDYFSEQLKEEYKLEKPKQKIGKFQKKYLKYKNKYLELKKHLFMT